MPAAPGGGEIGYLTDVFNHMVYRLRDSRDELDRINETLRKKNDELELLSTTDSLTGLSNHRFSYEAARRRGRASGEEKRGFSVLVGDVDHFKHYNDAFGHPAGDEVLQTIAEIMRDSTRKVDCCARYGGEEFVIVLPDTTAADALDTAEHIRARVAAKKFSGRKMTLSIGVATFPEDADDAESIIAVADEAYIRRREGAGSDGSGSQAQENRIGQGGPENSARSGGSIQSGELYSSRFSLMWMLLRGQIYGPQ